MRNTQGCFSFLPDLTDEQITAQIQLLHRQGLGGEHRIHRRPASPQHVNWEMWGHPMFDVADAAGVMLELRECRRTYGDRYIRLSGFDSTHGWESVRISFLVNRPAIEPSFALMRTEVGGALRAIHHPSRGPLMADSETRIDLRAEFTEAGGRRHSGGTGSRIARPEAGQAAHS